MRLKTLAFAAPPGGNVHQLNVGVKRFVQITNTAGSAVRASRMTHGWSDFKGRPPMTRFPGQRLSPLTLGTVQLGMAYGVANPPGMPDAAAARAVLDAAWNDGITCFDTARAYGEAEARIGHWLDGRPERPLIVTKFPPIDATAALDGHLAASRAALRIESPDGWLAHRASDLARRSVADRLRALAKAGRIGGFGVSAYTPDDVRSALAVPGLALVQAPVSLFDRRLARAGLIECCAEAEVVLFARSAFLQGALFLDPARLPAHLASLSRPLARLRAIAAAAGLTLAALAVGYVRALPGIASVVLGALDPDQLSESMAAAPLDSGLAAELEVAVGDLPEAVLDPRRWPG